MSSKLLSSGHYMPLLGLGTWQVCCFNALNNNLYLFSFENDRVELLDRKKLVIYLWTQGRQK